MYVRCFTKTDSWNEWLSVKERLAIEIKQIVESNKACFSKLSIYTEKNDSLLIVLQILKLYSYVVIANVIVSWF